MHAYLVISQNPKFSQIKCDQIASKYKAEVIPTILQKIEDARKLIQLVSLKRNRPQLIKIDNFENATEEAQNAFLKSLEEGGDNLIYVLIAKNQNGILSTILSRCQLIKSPDTQSGNIDAKIISFLKENVGKRLISITKIKKRDEAISFVKKIIEVLHFNLLNRDQDLGIIAKDLEIAKKTLNNLKLNGNIQLQLTNMAIKLYNKGSL